MDSLRQALFRALAKSHLPMLRSALGLGVSLAYEPGDPAPVFHAALSGPFADLAVLQTLEAAGADPATCDAYDGLSPLHLAVALPDDRILEWFLSQGLDVNIPTLGGDTALMRAARVTKYEDSDPASGDWALRDARALIGAGADINLTDHAGRSALHHACEAGAGDMAALLVMAGADLSLVDSNDDTALHLAVGGGYDGIVRLLLEKGADPQALNSLGFSGLHILAERTSLDMTPAHLRIADALIQAGGDLTQHDNRGFTPLVAAAATGNIPIAAVFVARHADVSAEDGAALRQAVTFEDDDMTDLLIKAGAFVDQPSFPDQDQPLHTAAQEGFAHGVKVLLDKGADIEARNIDGETPLLVAVRCRKYEVVSLLLARGASVAAEDHYGVTAAGAAEQRRDQVMLRLLTPAEALKV
jgi:uncharacterized protein